MQYVPAVLLAALGLMPMLLQASSSLRGLENSAVLGRKARYRSLTSGSGSGMFLQAVADRESEKIVGGTTPASTDYPFFALLGDGSGFDFCGATLIWSNILLTAAHCEPSSTNDFVKIGPYGADHASPDGWIPIETSITHPNYDSGTLNYDFSILVIPDASAVPEGPFAGLAGDITDISNGTPVTPIGFGTTSFGGSASSVLLETDVEITICDAYGTLPDTMFCAGSTAFDKDSCQGDSGGPLFLDGDIVAGVVSWGNECALAPFPGVYANVKEVLPWIKQMVCQYGLDAPDWACNPATLNDPVPASWDEVITTTTTTTTSTTTTTEGTSIPITVIGTTSTAGATTTSTEPATSTTTVETTTTGEPATTTVLPTDPPPPHITCPVETATPCGDNGGLAMCKFNFRQEKWKTVCVNPYEDRHDERWMHCGCCSNDSHRHDFCPAPEPILQCPENETVACGKKGNRVAICEQQWDFKSKCLVWTTKCVNPMMEKWAHKDFECGCCGDKEGIRKKDPKYCPAPPEEEEEPELVQIKKLTCTAESATAIDDVPRCGRRDRNVLICHERHDGTFRERCVDPRKNKFRNKEVQCGEC